MVIRKRDAVIKEKPDYWSDHCSQPGPSWSWEGRDIKEYLAAGALFY